MTPRLQQVILVHELRWRTKMPSCRWCHDTGWIAGAFPTSRWPCTENAWRKKKVANVLLKSPLPDFTAKDYAGFSGSGPPIAQHFDAAAAREKALAMAADLLPDDSQATVETIQFLQPQHLEALTNGRGLIGREVVQHLPDPEYAKRYLQHNGWRFVQKPSAWVYGRTLGGERAAAKTYRPVITVKYEDRELGKFDPDVVFSSKEDAVRYVQSMFKLCSAYTAGAKSKPVSGLDAWIPDSTTPDKEPSD